MKSLKEGTTLAVYSVRVLICCENSKVLLIQRLDNKTWEPPGGKVKEDDLNIEEAAIREVREETGLSVSLDRRPIYNWSKISSSRKYKGCRYICDIRRGYLTDILEKPIKVKLDLAHNAYKWVDLLEKDSLKGLKIVPEVREAIDILINDYIRKL